MTAREPARFDADAVADRLVHGPTADSERASLARLIVTALAVVALVLFVHLLVVLFTGGYHTKLLGKRLRGEIAPTLMLLSTVVMAALVVRKRLVSLRAFAADAAGVLFFGLLVVYLANGTTIWSGDTIPTRYLPMSLLREGNFDLNEFPALYTNGSQYYIRAVKGRWLSEYPVGAALAAMPMYLPSALGRVALDSPFLVQVEKMAAATIAAASVAVLYLALLRLTTPGVALVIAAVYGLGTSTLSVSSQALWQHGPSQLALATAFYALLRARDDRRWLLLGGFATAFSVVARPMDIVLAMPLSVYTLLHHRWRAWLFVGGACVPALFQVGYNVLYFGAPLHSQLDSLGGGVWSTPVATGLLGILVSPSRGLFIYSPVLALSVVGAVLAWRRSEDPLLRWLVIGTAAGLVLYAKWLLWWGGHSFGPRLLADLTPGMAMLLVPLGGALTRSRAFASLFAVLALWSIAAHGVGAFLDDDRWNTSPNVDVFTQRLWSWTDMQLATPFIELANREASRGLPTSRRAHDLLASYRTDLPSSVVIGAGTQMAFSLTATNTGRAVWLSTGRGDVGVVDLGCGWYGDNRRRFAEPDRLPLRFRILPGRSYEFLVRLEAPREPATYTLECGLVSESVAWFADVGTPPVRATVTVTPR